MKKSHLKQFIKEEIRSVLKESINESKKYTKGDKLHVKLKSGKEFDVVFDSYSSTDGIAFGRIDGETKPFSLNAVVESINEDKEWSSYEQRMVNQIKAAKKEGLGMYQLPMKTQDFYRKHKGKFDEPINEDQFEASLSDPKKYKMGTMWFKRWMKPKKEMDGWTWEDDGRYIWLTRPDMNRPTVRFEKDTGLLQGNWVDPKEMQWE